MSGAADDLAQAMTDGRVPFSEDDLADRFSTAHADLKFVAAWNKWLQWTGVKWEIDSTVHVFDHARAICREAAAKCNEPSRKVASAATVAAVERLARSDRRHAMTAEDFDAGPFLLNTPGGTVDLRTGDIRPNAPGDYSTKATAVAPGGDCPTWRAFLARITDGDADLANFLQQIAGYALTGSTREHAIFFTYGTGAKRGRAPTRSSPTAVSGKV